MVIEDKRIRNMKDAELAFVIESIDGHHIADYDEKFCKENTSAEWRPLIERCTGLIRLRDLRPEERSQMEAFKSEAEGGPRLVFEYQRIL